MIQRFIQSNRRDRQKSATSNRLLLFMAIQTLVFFLFVAIPLQAKTEYAPTAEYYAAIDGLKDEALKTKLREIIFHRTKWYRYGSGANKSWDAFYQTDRDSSDNSVIDMYSNTKRYFNPDIKKEIDGVPIDGAFFKDYAERMYLIDKENAPSDLGEYDDV